MNTTRYNLFNQVHKGLRALLYETALAIQHTDFLQPQQAALTFKKIEKVLWMFEGHADIEDSVVFPQLVSVAPDVVKDFEEQHETDHRLGQDLGDIIASYGYAQTPADRQQCGINLLLAFNEFTAFNLQHMNKEETIIMGLFWQHFTDEGLFAMEREIVSRVPPDKQEFSQRYMLRGLNDAEINGWLQKVKRGAPEPVFKRLIELAPQELPEERWLSLKDVLEQETLLSY
jgi:hypothetical protein